MTARDELLALADSIEGWGETFGGKQSPGIVKISLTKSDRAAIVAALRDHRAGQQAPVAWTNEAQLGFLKDPSCKDIPMAMWSSESKAGHVPLYTTPSQGDAGAREDGWSEVRETISKLDVTTDVLAYANRVITIISAFFAPPTVFANEPNSVVLNWEDGDRAVRLTLGKSRAWVLLSDKSTIQFRGELATPSDAGALREALAPKAS